MFNSDSWDSDGFLSTKILRLCEELELDSAAMKEGNVSNRSDKKDDSSGSKILGLSSSFFNFSGSWSCTWSLVICNLGFESLERQGI